MKKVRTRFKAFGAGFIPTVLNTKVYDSISQVPNEAAFETARAMAEKEGILVGISSGAAVWSALQLAKQPETKQTDCRAAAFLW